MLKTAEKSAKIRHAGCCPILIILTVSLKHHGQERKRNHQKVQIFQSLLKKKKKRNNTGILILWLSYKIKEVYEMSYSFIKEEGQWIYVIDWISEVLKPKPCIHVCCIIYILLVLNVNSAHALFPLYKPWGKCYFIYHSNFRYALIIGPAWLSTNNLYKRTQTPTFPRALSEMSPLLPSEAGQILIQTAALLLHPVF